MKEPEVITRELVEAHGLTPEEMERVRTILGREPTFTELGIFSVMWSEHCSYKSSRLHLKKLPACGPAILVGAGLENAGVVDIGDGRAVVFKMESHNHPSAVEPFQGAATGVGGIIRDIFTMGARPIALMNSLRFGPLHQPRSRWLLKGVVGGIASYGNCMGIPTVGGEVSFDETYQGNPLVNVFCLGVVDRDAVVHGSARGPGNSILYVGSATGRDGLGGASFASRELTDESHEDRPAVQIGDPFMEKLLLEATLELIETGTVVGMQDMGAAGITSSSVETAARGGAGVEIDLAHVPRRETSMIPYEIMLSESQERMLVIVERGREAEAQQIFEKWDLHAVTIGQVTDDERFVVREGSQVVAEIPVGALTDEAPMYSRACRRPDYLRRRQRLDSASVPEPVDYGDVLKQLLASPSIASKRWVYEQYDHMVRTNTVLPPGPDAALVRVKGTQKALALSCDGNGRHCYLDPYLGGMGAVAEAARNVVCTGAKPLALTNCLNFGTPTDPEVFWQFLQSVKGMSRACRALGTPVTGGNVSFYNENPEGAIDPTPVIGMVGLLDNVRTHCSAWFKQPGDVVAVLGRGSPTLGGSEYLQSMHGMKRGRPPAVNLGHERQLQDVCREAIEKGMLQSAHDCADGGLLVAVAECCVLGPNPGSLGATLELDDTLGHSDRFDCLLFGETHSWIVVSCREADYRELCGLADRRRVPCRRLGRVAAARLELSVNGVDVMGLPVSDLHSIWEQAVPCQLGVEVERTPGRITPARAGARDRE